MEKFFCKRCNNLIGSFNRKGYLEVICPHCRNVNKFSNNIHSLGAIHWEFQIDSDKKTCRKCYRPIVKILDEAVYKIKCRVCGTINTNFQKQTIIDGDNFWKTRDMIKRNVIKIEL